MLIMVKKLFKIPTGANGGDLNAPGVMSLNVHWFVNAILRE